MKRIDRGGDMECFQGKKRDKGYVKKKKGVNSEEKGGGRHKKP